MSEYIKLKKGLDIKIKGEAARSVEQGISSDTYAIKPPDFISFIKPKLLVKVGDSVKAGTPLFYDKSRPEVKFVAPVSGEVVAINRGEKRKLEEIVVLADKQLEYVEYSKYNTSDIANISAEDLKLYLAECGVWPNLIQRPYAVIADTADSPKAIFVSAFDTNPLAPDYEILYKDQKEHFKTGIQVLSKLTSGKVHLNTNADGERSQIFNDTTGVQKNEFSGPHPAGNVGVQIHHLDPINKDEVAWTINPYGVIQIGKLFNENKYDASKIIAITGSEVSKPQYYTTYLGASMKNFLSNNLKSDNVRVISGSVLSGESIGKEGYIGFYDQMITVIPEGDNLRFFGSFVPTRDKHSFGRSIGLLSFMNGKDKVYDVDTNINGEIRAFVQTGVLERVLPMDIYPVHLLKAIMAEDFEEMEALGIYEVAEEDLALCEYVDVSKHEVQSIIRSGIELMQNS